MSIVPARETLEPTLSPGGPWLNQGYFATGLKKLYEVELTANGHGKDISIDEQGNVVEMEEELVLGSLPTAVKDGLAKAAGKDTITKVESLSKRGNLIAYEATVKTGTKKSEVQVGPDGKKLACPE